MSISSIRLKLSSSLRTRVLLLALLAFAAVSVPTCFGFVAIVNATVVKLGTLFAEKQVLFDRSRGLGALLQEVTLAQTLASSEVIRDWARNEGDPGDKARGIAELEHYRSAFADHSYFFVVGASGNYYFNDAQNSYAGKQLSYTLSRDNPRDAWYYTTAALGEGCHLNVDHDDVLGVTKVWFNCVIAENGKVLGVLGSGLDLTAFVHQVVDFPQTGVTAMFIDPTGAVQAHRDPRLVDFHSLTKAAADKKTIFALIDRPEDRAAMAEMIKAVTRPDVEVQSRFMQVEGREVLVGIGYLDQLGWYNVTLMDIDKIIDRGLFLPIGALLAAVMLALAVAAVLLFKRFVTDRLERLEVRFAAVRAGRFQPVPVDRGNDEIGRLSRAFADLAASVGDNTRMLEEMVGERTEELRTIAYRDQLTEIANRRGFIEAFEAVRRTAMPGDRLCLLLIDIDEFKAINDGFGHHVGDQVVVETARRLTDVLRPVDTCARWGGDEFIVLISDIGTLGLRPIAETIRTALSADPVQLGDSRPVHFTVSVGATLLEGTDNIDVAADMADAALYRAKAEGRNRVVVFDDDWAKGLARSA